MTDRSVIVNPTEGPRLSRRRYSEVSREWNTGRFCEELTGLAFGKPMTGTTHRVARSHSTNCLEFNFQTATTIPSRTVIARSEATKQSILPLCADGLLRFARNDVAPIPARYTFAMSRRDAPELCIYLSPPWRAWGMPGARCTRGLVCTLYW
jgi:hypothetical protein